MTEMDDLELSLRLRALRVDPPQSGFEARLAARLQALAPEPGQAAPEPAPRREERRGRVILGPWLRRGPVRLIGATALFLAGAAAALEGGVIEWVQARVEAVRNPPPPPPTPGAPERADPPARSARAERTPEPALEPALETLRAPEPPPAESPPSVPRLAPERRLPERRIDAAREAAPIPERRHTLDVPSVPRLEIDRRGPERRADPDTRLGRPLGNPGEAALARERGQDLERIRDIAKARREQVKDERPRLLERVRERRERINAERREMPERGRGGRPIR